MLGDQARLDPMDVLTALVGEVRRHGGTVTQGQRVRRVSLRGRPRPHLEGGVELEAEHVVLATGVPVLDRGLSLATIEPQRFYALADVSAPEAEGMYLSAGSDSRSVRDAPRGDGTALLVGSTWPAARRSGG